MLPLGNSRRYSGSALLFFVALLASFCMPYAGASDPAADKGRSQVVVVPGSLTTQLPSPWNLRNYAPRRVAEADFRNTSRMDGMLRAGTLYLSLNDAIAIALENNLDLVVSRYDLPIADADVLRSRSGGGAVPSFDPSFSLNTQLERAAQPQTNSLYGGSILSQHTGTANFSYNQGFATGTTFSFGFQNQRLATDSTLSTLSPQLSTALKFTVTQHLLQGFGVALNRREIRIAQNKREIANVTFRQQVISVVTQVENIYWDLVSASEDVKVKQQSIDLAKKTLEETQEQVQAGTVGKLETARWESQLASAQQDLITSQTALKHQELLMKTAISRNLTDPALIEARVIPTDAMLIPDQEPVIPTGELIAQALSHRPELAKSRIDLVNREITRKAQRNTLRPSLDLVASYGTSAVGGVQNPLATCRAGSAAFCTPAGTYGNTGYGSVLSNLFGSTTDKAVGFNLQIPIRNRSAQADQIQGELQYRQAEAKLHQAETQVRSDVRDAQTTLLQNRARIEAGRKAVEFARQSLDAEQQKYAAGVSTSVSVLQAQRDLTQAQSNLIAAMTAYKKARVDLDQKTGLTLSSNDIDIAGAVTGTVEKPPQVPGVTPAKRQ